MANSPTLGLTLMSASQAQKEVVFNEFLLAIDSLFRGVVINSTLTTTPISPNEGDTYIIGPGATGAWSGQDHNITFYFNGWQFVTAKDQMRMYDQAATVWRVFHAGTTSWDAEPASTVSVLNDLTNVSGAPSDGQVLTFKASDGKWEPKNPVFTAAMRTLTDVNVTEGSAINGYALLWNNADSKWEAGAVLTAKPAVLTLPDVTTPTGIRDGWIMVYNATGPGVKFVDPTSITLVRSLSNVGDVAYPSGGSGVIASGAYLQWNGAAWVPSTSAVSISVQSLSNGPGAFTGNAGKYVCVDSTETGLEYVTLSGGGGGGSSALAGDTDVSLSSPSDGQVLTYSAASSKWVNATPSGGTGGGGSSTLAGDTDVGIAMPSNGQVLTYNAGASQWQNQTPTIGSGGSGLTPPVASLLTAVTNNPHGDILQQRTSGGVPSLTVSPSASDGGGTLFCALMANPMGSRAFSVVTKVKLTDYNNAGGWSGAGLVLHNSANSNNSYFWLCPNGQIYEGEFSGGFTSASVNLGGATANNYFDFLHADYDGTNIKFGVSPNGIDVQWIRSVTLASFLGAVTHVGIGWDQASSGAVYSWEHFYIGAQGANGIGMSGNAALLPAQYEYGAFAPPSSAWFTSAPGYSGIPVTFTDVANRGLSITMSGAGSAAYICGGFRDCTGWGSNWAVTVRMIASHFLGSYPSFGLGVLDSSGKADMTIALASGGTLHMIHNYWNSVSSFSGNELDDGVSSPHIPEWFRLKYDGSYFYWGWSYDGLIWNERKSSRSAFLGSEPQKVFLYVNAYTNNTNWANTGIQGGVLVTYYDDPDYPASTRQKMTVAKLGDLYDAKVTGTPSNGRVLAYNAVDGKWEDAVPPGANSPPSTTLFTYSADGTGVGHTVTLDAVKGLSLLRTDTGTGGDAASVYCKNVPSGSAWSVTARVRTIMHGVANCVRGGLCLHNSSSKETILLGVMNQGGTAQLNVFIMSDLNTYSSSPYSANLASSESLPEWFRISWDGANYKFYASFDNGITFTLLATLSASSYFTADKVGFCSESFITFVAAGVLCLSYSDPDISAPAQLGSYIGAVPYNIAVSISGVMQGNEVLLQYVAPQSFTLPAGLMGSHAIANNAATGSVTVTINKNGSAIGSIAWSSAGTVGAFAFTSAITFSAGDVLQLVAPATADATLADVGITFAGTKG